MVVKRRVEPERRFVVTVLRDNCYAFLTMKPESKADDLLTVLLYGLDKILHPSPSNILECFEAWNYRNRLRPHLRLLERSKLLCRQASDRGETYRLTERGRVAAWGKLDPAQRWQRPWDGQWRLLMFDLPSGRQALRVRLWRWLRGQRFGYLQNSVWVSPDPLDETMIPLKEEISSAESFIVIVGRPGAGASDRSVVTGAWDIAAVNTLYQTHLDLLAEAEEFSKAERPNPAVLNQWLSQERLAWIAAAGSDPLLPEPLLPEGYLGRQAWQRRQTVIADLITKVSKPA